MRRLLHALVIAAALAVVVERLLPVQADINFRPKSSAGSGGGCSADCTFTGTTTLDSISADGSTPTCAVTGAGTGATCSVDGADSSGTITVSTGTSPTSGMTITLDFDNPRSPPACIGTLRNDGANWTAAATVRVASSTDETHCVWSITNGSTLTASDSYALDYFAVFH